MPKFLDNIEFYDDDGELRKITDLEPEIRAAAIEEKTQIKQLGDSYEESIETLGNNLKSEIQGLTNSSLSQVQNLTTSGLEQLQDKIDELDPEKIAEEIEKLQQFDSSHNNIENGEGVKSLTLEQENTVVKQSGSNGYVLEKNGTGVFGKGSVNLSTAGNTSANYFLNIGSLNIVEGNLSQADDGGIISGYKHFSSNSRATNLFGAWNRAIKSNQSLISGYRNTVVDQGHTIVSGQNNFVHGSAIDSATFGYSLDNRFSRAMVIGHFNSSEKLSSLVYAGDGLVNPKYGSPLFVIGNGSNTPVYNMLRVVLENIGLTKTALVQHNLKYKENPLGEGLYYNSETFDFSNLILNEADIPVNEKDGRPYAFKRIITTRNNAFAVTSNGRAILERGTTDLSFDDLKDNDILTKFDVTYMFDTLNIKNGEGVKSLTLEQNTDEVAYEVANNGYSISIEGTGALQPGAVNFSQNSKVNRKHFLNVGAKNIVDFNTNSSNSKLNDEDGGILAGYKLYSDSRGTSLFGAWNRAINSAQSLITGYRNTAIDSAYIIGSGQNNYVLADYSVTLGEDLVNKWRSATVLGRGNAYSVQDVYNVLNKKNPLLIVGNSGANLTFEMKTYILGNIKDKEMSIDDFIENKIVNHNKKYRENPLGEDLYFYKNEYNFKYLILSKNYIDADTGESVELNANSYVFKRECTNRSNAFIISEDGRAILNKKPNAVVGNNDLLTNAEIDTKVSEAKSYTDDKIASLDYDDPSTIDTSFVNGFIATVEQVDGKISATKANKLEALQVQTSPTISSGSTDVVRGNELANLSYGLTIDKSRTITKISQTDGKIAAEAEEIEIYKNQVHGLTDSLDSLDSRIKYLLQGGLDLLSGTLGDTILWLGYFKLQQSLTSQDYREIFSDRDLLAGEMELYTLFGDTITIKYEDFNNKTLFDRGEYKIQCDYIDEYYNVGGGVTNRYFKLKFSNTKNYLVRAYSSYRITKKFM